MKSANADRDGNMQMGESSSDYHPSLWDNTRPSGITSQNASSLEEEEKIKALKEALKKSLSSPPVEMESRRDDASNERYKTATTNGNSETRKTDWPGEAYELHENINPERRKESGGVYNEIYGTGNQYESDESVGVYEEAGNGPLDGVSDGGCADSSLKNTGFREPTKEEAASIYETMRKDFTRDAFQMLVWISTFGFFCGYFLKSYITCAEPAAYKLFFSFFLLAVAAAIVIRLNQKKNRLKIIASGRFSVFKGKGEAHGKVGKTLVVGECVVSLEGKIKRLYKKDPKRIWTVVRVEENGRQEMEIVIGREKKKKREKNEVNIIRKCG